MSSIRQLPHTVPAAGSAIVCTWFPLADGAGFSEHAHEHHQLAWTTSGAVTISTRANTWVLPPSRGLLIPAGIAHSTYAARNADLCGIYIDPDEFPHPWAEPTVVQVGDLLAALLTHLTEDALSQPERHRVEQVVFDQLAPAPVTTLHLSMPTDERALRVAQALQADVTDHRTLAEWGQEVGASHRTLGRAFVKDTGMTFSQWRTEARVSCALPLLASGSSVEATARAVGYATPSAFVAAFRRATGSAPGRYFNP